MDIDDFLKKHGIDHGRIVSRYIQILRMIHAFINSKGIAQITTIDTTMLKTAIYDYFVDIARIKEFHPITRTNHQKIYSYEAYWILKRKPIQVKTVFSGSEFINELFIAAFILALMFNEKKIETGKRKQHNTLEDFQSLLIYNLKYRLITQQSLELMIEAFFCGYDFPN